MQESRVIWAAAHVYLLYTFVELPVTEVKIGVDAQSQNGDEQYPEKPVPKGAECVRCTGVPYRSNARIFDGGSHYHKDLWRQRSNKADETR